MILLLHACVGEVPDREAYVEASRSMTFEDAWTWCGRIDEPDPRGDCQSGAVERFARFEACPEVEPGRWRDECLFVAAETLGRRGELDDAFTACTASTYRSQCQDHLLGLLSMQLLDAPFPEVVAALARLRPQLTDPRAELHFWRGYWRNRVGRALPIDATTCPTPTCTGAAEQEVSAFIMETQRRLGTASFCVAPPPEVPWAVSAETRAWVAAQHARGCANPPKPLESPPPRR